MWLYIIILVFIVCLFTLRPFPNITTISNINKNSCKEDIDKIEDLVMLPPAPAVPLVKH